MDQFLPDDYDVPNAAANYMKFQQGTNKFRVLGSAIIGYELWVDTDEGRKT